MVLGFQRAAGQNHRGIDADKIRFQPRDLSGRGLQAPDIVARQTDHHLDPHFIFVILEKLHGFNGICSSMAAVAAFKHAIVHGLNTQLNGGYRKRFDRCQPLMIDGIRSGRETNAIRVASGHIFCCDRQHTLDGLGLNPQKIPAKKGNLTGTALFMPES